MEICMQNNSSTLITSRNGYSSEQVHSRDKTTNALESRLRHLDIRDKSTQTIKNMSGAVSNGNDCTAHRTKITVGLIQEKDIPEMMALLKEYFFKGEPMNIALNIGVDCKELEEFAVKSLPNDCSFKAVNGDGEIIGVILNAVVNRPAPGEVSVSQTEKCQHQQFKKILKLFDYIDTQFDIFDLYPDIDHCLDGKIMTVNENYRGCGIAGILLARVFEYMRAQQTPLYTIMCTSYYSGRVCEKSSFKRVYELKFADYVVDGEPPILPADPHKSVQIFVKELSEL